MALNKPQYGDFDRSNPDVEKRNPEAFKFARGWRCDVNVWIEGNIGAGKTFIAQALGKVAKDKHEARITFVSAMALFRYGSRDHPNSLFEHAKVRKLLIIDDLDKMDIRFVSRFYEVMEARHRKAYPTIITANSSMKRLKQHFINLNPENENHIFAAFDRLKPCHTIVVRGKSLRPDIDA